MATLEAVDAKTERARSELRLLKADIAAFCHERARLIVREECDDGRERWVYRGDTPKAPIKWSIRAGEFAYNLRSALDHLVWQLVEVNGGVPSRSNQFPIQHSPKEDDFSKKTRGISRPAADYMKSVQPYQRSKQLYPPDFERVGNGLAILDQLRNIDTHRHLAIANARWSGKPPKRRKLSEYEATGYETNITSKKPRELQHGQTIATTSGYKDWQYLEFPIDAFFEGLQIVGIPKEKSFSVTETLDACIDGVEMAVGHLRKEFD